MTKANKVRVAQWINTLLSEISSLKKEQGIELLNKCGSNCCENSALYEAAKDTSIEFASIQCNDQRFDYFKTKYYNSDKLLKEGDRITLIFDACTCPLVELGVDQDFLCNCTSAYSKKIFETLFGCPVTVSLKKSILKGDKQCKQIIHLL